VGEEGFSLPSVIRSNRSIEINWESGLIEEGLFSESQVRIFHLKGLKECLTYGLMLSLRKCRYVFTVEVIVRKHYTDLLDDLRRSISVNYTSKPFSSHRF